MHPELVGFDFDGVLANSRAVAFSALERIGRIFSHNTSIRTMRQYRTVFDQLENLYLPSGHDVDVLRALHRLLVRSERTTIPPFAQVIDVALGLRDRPALISSSLRDTVVSVLGSGTASFAPIYCQDDGPKHVTLAKWADGRRALYVTDNVTDIHHCRTLGISVAAVSWGFDAPRDLRAKHPNWFVNSPAELLAILNTLNLTRK